MTEGAESIVGYSGFDLVEECYGVDIASDGQSGLRLARSGEYDLVLLDIKLLRRDIHMGDPLCLDFKRFTMVAGPTDWLDKHIVFIERGRGLSDDTLLFDICCHIFNFISDNTVTDNAVGSFNKTELVDLRI